MTSFKKSLNRIILNISIKLLFAPVSVIAILAVFKSNAVCISPDRKNEVKDRIQRIISSKEFNTSDKKSGKTIWQVIADAVKSFWNWLTGRVDKEINRAGVPKKSSAAEGAIGSVLLIVLKILCIFFILAFLAAVIFFVFKGLKRSKKIKQIKDSQLLHSLKDPNTLENKAAEYAEKGQYRLALRFLYISMLLSMNESNIIRIDKSKTNRQYLNEIKMNDSKNYELSCAFTDEFNRCWYGNREIFKDRFEYWRQNYNMLVRGGA